MEPAILDCSKICVDLCVCLRSPDERYIAPNKIKLDIG